jgi:hypothetical protein
MFDRLWNSFFALDPQTRAACITAVGTIVSVLGALVGIYLNLRWNRSKHRTDQLLNLRRDVYVNANEAIIAAVLFLTRLPEKETDVFEGTQISERLGAVAAKIYLLGENRTRNAMVALQRQFVQSHLEMLLVKLRLGGDYQRLAVIDKRLEQLEAVKAKATDQKTRFRTAHEAGKMSADELTSIESQIDSTLSQIPQFYERGAAIRKSFAELQKLSLELAAIAMPKLAPLSMELTLSLRAELGISGEDDSHRVEMLRFIKDGTEWLHQFIEEADDITAKTIKDCTWRP